jgi:hypothetical protein
MMDEKKLKLCAAILRSVVSGRDDVTEGMDVKVLARIAFEESRRSTGGWMLQDDEDRFRTGAAVVYLLASEEDKERVSRELRLLGTLSAAISGIPVNFGALEGVDEDDIIGLTKIYRDTDKEE